MPCSLALKRFQISVRCVQYAPSRPSGLSISIIRCGSILSPRVVVFQHQIIAQLGSIFELQQAIRLLKSDLFNEIYCIRCGKHNADMTDHKRIVRFRELIVQDYGDETNLIIFHEGEAAFLPFLLNSFQWVGISVVLVVLTGAEQRIKTFAVRRRKGILDQNPVFHSP